MSSITKSSLLNRPNTKLPGRMTLFVGILAVLIVAAACGEQLTPTEPGQTATVTQEWNLQDIEVDGSTVTVQLTVFAGIDVDATLDGQPADEVKSDPPDLDYVFTNIQPGTHTINVQDVVGHIETTEIFIPEITSVKLPTEDGVCLPAAPLAVSVGDTWTLSGSVITEGNFSEGIPEGAVESISTATVTAIEDREWVVIPGNRELEGEPVVVEDYKRVIVESTITWLDAGGNVLDTQVEQISGSTINVSNLSPVLSLDWDCHSEAWLRTATTENLPEDDNSNASYSVEERTLPSGKTAVVFSLTQTVILTDQGLEITANTGYGYDNLSGKLVLLESTSSGTQNGDPFSLVLTQELVSEDTVSIINGGIQAPQWLTSLIDQLASEPVGNPPASVTSYLYEGGTVYFVPPQRCYDFFSDLYDVGGNIIGHPDGGITGQGDGSVPDFFDERSNEQTVWKDERTLGPGIAQVLAPIESVELLILESFPVQYNVNVVVGLPNACVSFDGYYLERTGDTVQIQVFNQQPFDVQVACAEVY